MSTNLDKNLIIVKTIKKVVITLITLIGFSLFIGCEDEHQLEPIDFVLNTGLNQDVNGYYHLQLNPSSFQTLHRLSGHIYLNDEPLEVMKKNYRHVDVKIGRERVIVGDIPDHISPDKLSFRD